MTLADPTTLGLAALARSSAPEPAPSDEVAPEAPPRALPPPLPTPAVLTATGIYLNALGGTGTGLTFNTSGFEVRIDTTQPALTGLFLTVPNNDGSPDGDFRDSDGILQGVIAVATFNTGGPGDNNHTYDFGFNNSLVQVTPTAPTTPPGTPGTPVPGATPVAGTGGTSGTVSQPGGPTLSKIVDRPFALPGRNVRIRQLRRASLSSRGSALP